MWWLVWALGVAGIGDEHGDEGECGVHEHGCECTLMQICSQTDPWLLSY